MASPTDRRPMRVHSQAALAGAAQMALVYGLLAGCTLVSPSAPPKAVSTPLDPMLRTRTTAAEAAAAADAARRRSEAAVQQAMP